MIYAGMDAATADILVRGAGAYSMLFSRGEGEVMRHKIAAPPDHRICNVRWKVYSLTENAHLAIDPNNTSVEVYSYARKNNIGGPGEWVRAFIEVRTWHRSERARGRDDDKCLERESLQRGFYGIATVGGRDDEAGNLVSVEKRGGW